MHHLRAAMADNRGFTLVEIIAALIIMGILVAVAINRATSNSDTGRIVQESVIKNHIRYAQSMAMKSGSGATDAERLWGIKCDGADYWLFRTNAPDTAANQISLPDEDNIKVTLAGKNVQMNAFTVFFDASGRPYTAYTDATTNTPVSAANPLPITVDSVPAGAAATFGITPETGFIP
jgi:prepilin-type N-terminal cleavage/methylation domain-containing protein